MTTRVRILRSVLERAVRHLHERPDSALDLHAGVHVMSGGTTELLVPCRLDSSHEPSSTVRVKIYLLPESMSHVGALHWKLAPPPIDADWELVLVPFKDRSLSAVLRNGEEVHEIDRIDVVGSRLDRLTPARPPTIAADELPRHGRHSRYIGALGGKSNHERLCSQSYALIGCSRLGTMVGTHLARAGVRRVIALDGDVTELHAVDAMDVYGPEAVEHTKVDGFAAFARTFAPDTTVVPIPHPLEHPRSLEAAREVDVLITAPDSGHPRLVAGLLANAYLKLHVDVGVAVTHDASGRMQAGIDLRLFEPGDGCIACRGGVAPARDEGSTWWAERAGSLRSLNGIASSMAMFLIERYVGGDVVGSVWRRVTLDQRIRPANCTWREGAPRA